MGIVMILINSLYVISHTTPCRLLAVKNHTENGQGNVFLYIRSTSIYQELVRNANSHVPPQIYQMRHSGAWVLQSVL